MPVNLTSEIGRSGLAAFGGRIREEFLTELRGKEGYKRYNEMRSNSPEIASMLLAVEQAIRQLSWSYISDEGEDDPRLELLNASLENMSHTLRDHVIEVLTMLPFGYSVFELVYERVGGWLLWHKFAPRGQDTILQWDMDENGGLNGVVQQAPPIYGVVPIPIEKLVIYRTRVERNNPEGRSILRAAWIPYYYVKNLQQIEAIGIERDLAGLPHIEMPEGANIDESNTTSDYNRAKNLVARIRNDETAGVVTPYGWTFKLVSTGGSRAFDTDKIIQRYGQRMLMSTLAQFLMLGAQGVGSLALSKDQTDFFTMSVNATADIIADTHTKFAAARLLELNGYSAQGIHMQHTPAGDIDLTSVADFLQKVGSLMTWTAQDEAWLRRVARLPEVAPEEIDAERERKRAASAPILEALAKARQAQQPVDETNPEEMHAEQFVAAPDEDARMAFEERWNRTFKRFFGSQRKRVVSGARQIKRFGAEPKDA